MSKITTVGASIVAFFAPLFAFAQSSPVITGGQSGQGLLLGFMRLLSLAMPILTTLAVLYFIWNVITFVMADGPEKSKKRETLIWGLVALFVILAVWGIIAVISNTLDIGVGGSLPTPELPTDAF